MAIMTMAQALVKFLDNQYVMFDQVEYKFVEGIFTIFGHGIVCGVGQALDENPNGLKVYQGKNEQGMAHAATAFAKQNNRLKIIPCSSSIGPGAANMITAAATATVNNIPLLLLPGDSFASRQPDPVLQQIEQENSISTTTNDAFKPVCKYWDRITRPEQLMWSMINAMRVLTDPAQTGAVCIALSQDVEGESFDYPDYFFEKRVHRITRHLPDSEEIADVVNLFKHSKKPLVICGGGVRYSKAGEELEKFCKEFNIPFAETQAGKSACLGSDINNLGGIGVTGNSAANNIAVDADLVLAVGSRLSDFTTASKSLFKNKNMKLATINISRFHSYKQDSTKIVSDAKTGLQELYNELKKINYKSNYVDEIQSAKNQWQKEMDFFKNYKYDEKFEPIVKAGHEGSISEFAKATNTDITQVSAISLIRELIDKDAIIVGASGSLPGDLQRMWTTDVRDSYHMEYGYSCMGYEVSGALGVKLCEPDKEVYAMTGDGSFLMLHSELLTSIQENKKINVLLFDNSGFGCINNLQMSNEISNIATEFRKREGEEKHNSGELLIVDYAKIAEGYGVKSYVVTNLEELKNAIIDAKKQTGSTLIDIKTLPKTMTEGYEAWWNVGVASWSSNDKVIENFNRNEENKKDIRLY